MKAGGRLVEEALGTSQKGSRRSLRVIKLSIFSVLMILISGLTSLVASTSLITFAPFDNPVANGMLNYQLSALPVVGLALLVTFLFAGRVRLRYLNFRRTGPLRPYFAQPVGGRWESDGWYLALIMCGIVGVVTFFQFLPGGFTFHWATLMLVIPFAASNAFIEETLYRLPYVTMGENDTSSNTYGLVMGSVVFGVMHYWGVAPAGLIGAVMSAFLGFILAKSMQETRGFYWAFVIHFLLDIVVIFFILNQAPQ